MCTYKMGRWISHSLFTEIPILFCVHIGRYSDIETSLSPLSQVWHTDTFDSRLFSSLPSFTMFQSGFLSCVTMVLAVTIPSIHIYIHLESDRLYFDLCMQYSSEIRSCVLMLQLNEGTSLEATNHPDIVHLPTKIIWKYIPFKFTRKIFTNLLVVCFALSSNIRSLCCNKVGAVVFFTFFVKVFFLDSLLFTVALCRLRWLRTKSNMLFVKLEPCVISPWMRAKSWSEIVNYFPL